MLKRRLTLWSSLILLAAASPALADEVTLEARVQDLEKRLYELERNRNTVQAPFKVVDSKGAVLMSVDLVNNVATVTVGSPEKGMVRLIAEGDAGRLAVGGAGGKSLFLASVDADGVKLTGKSEGMSSLTLGDPAKTMSRMYVDGDKAAVTAVSQSGAVLAMLSVGPEGAQCAARNPDLHAQLGASKNGVEGLLISKSDKDSPMGELAVRPGKQLALRLYNDAGQAVVTAGTNPLAGGAGTVRAANTKGENVAFLGTSEDGAQGALGVAKNGRNTAALLSEPRMVVVYNDAGEAIVTLAKSQEGAGEGGNITVRQPTGEGIFSAGYNAEAGGGDACVYRNKKQTVFCIGLGTPGMGTVGR